MACIYIHGSFPLIIIYHYLDLVRQLHSCFCCCHYGQLFPIYNNEAKNHLVFLGNAAHID
jgi:hypothetical protein